MIAGELRALPACKYQGGCSVYLRARARVVVSGARALPVFVRAYVVAGGLRALPGL